MLNAPINTEGELSIYRQIMRQITEAIASGQLLPREKLPSHRDLSEKLVVAPLTVKKAYDELEHLGYIETQRGRGTFVCARLPKANRAAQREEIKEGARSLLCKAYLAEMDFDDVVRLLEEVNGTLSIKEES